MTRRELRQRPNCVFRVALEGETLRWVTAKTAENALKQVGKGMPADKRAMLVAHQQ